MKGILPLMAILIMGLGVSGQSPTPFSAQTPKPMATPPPKTTIPNEQSEKARDFIIPEKDEPVILIARAGDTVKTLADRFWVDPSDLAKYNGLLVDSVLSAGREIKVPPTPDNPQMNPVAIEDAPVVLVAPTPKPMATPSPVKKVSEQAKFTCTMTIAQSPSIRGLKLGMTETEVERLVGNKYKFENQTMEPTRGLSFLASTVPDFEGISFVTLESYDRKLSKISVMYGNEIKWDGIEEFVENFSPKLGIKGRVWQKEARQGASVRCAEFDLALRILGGSWLHLTDTLAVKKIAADLNKAEAEKKKSLKP